MNDIENIKLPEKKISIPPPAPKFEATTPAQKEQVLIPWPDGMLLKHAPNPAKIGTYILADGSKRAVALACDAMTADVLCKALHHYVQSAARALKEQEMKQSEAIENGK